MKLITYIYKNKTNVGFVEDDKVFKIDKENMIDLISSYDDIDFKSLSKGDEFIDVKDVEIVSPIQKPIHDIICVGKNYAEHIREVGSEVEDTPEPCYFGKRASKIMGPDDSVIGRFDLDEQVDYEVELAVIIGKECKNVKKEDVADYIFGYAIFNDLSSRAMQARHQQWFRGKSLDGYSAMGPYIVTKDSFDHNDKYIRSYVNDELRQDNNTDNMMVKIEEIIAQLSEGMTLEPGDIISTGTPEGVGLGFTPPKFLKKGDTVRCEIEGLGTLSNKII